MGKGKMHIIRTQEDWNAVAQEYGLPSIPLRWFFNNLEEVEAEDEDERE